METIKKALELRKKIKSKKPKILRKKAIALEERERLRRDLESIRGRISKLGKLLPEE